MTHQVSSRLSQDQLSQISVKLFERVTDLLDLFEIEYEELGNRSVGHIIVSPPTKIP